MKKYTYTASSNTIWASFDCGEVIANNEDEAIDMAKEEIKERLKYVNIQLGLINESIHIDLDNIEIEECDETNK